MHFKIVTLLVLVLLFLSGCCKPEHIPGYVAGTYVAQPEEGTEGRYSKTFDRSYPACYEEVETALRDMGVSIRHKSKRKRVILAWFFDKVYDNCIDTTKVSIYFKELKPEKTQIDVACGNYGLAKFTSEELFGRLEKSK